MTVYWDSWYFYTVYVFVALWFFYFVFYLIRLQRRRALMAELQGRTRIVTTTRTRNNLGTTTTVRRNVYVVPVHGGEGVPTTGYQPNQYNTYQDPYGNSAGFQQQPPDSFGYSNPAYGMQPPTYRESEYQQKV